ncbi:DUF1573 domain-containing protein [Belliella sp. DSM 111904]|uniref:DUF1573 domain-containing protein n=1 Tax=Belliella filtrata TaxID=2923435 RepID=A0ABS9V4K2_9BACT|nr:DUF1573 domain-containing protein [Belliella filtrata]MCH7411332.1 DUF1573 domain-containing protein [Belliella filtrata]
MKIPVFRLLALFVCFGFAKVSTAQDFERNLLFWENRIIDVGTILQENGLVEVEFLGLNQTDSAIVITDVITDCGCTATSYDKDSIPQSKVSSIKVSYDPDYLGGPFTKMIIVRTNQDIYGDTLYLRGVNVTMPEDIVAGYPHKYGAIGFRLPVINMGNVYTNEPKTKMIEVYNFGKDSLKLTGHELEIEDDFITTYLSPEAIAPDSRGLIVLEYSASIRNDFGFLNDQVLFHFNTLAEPVRMSLIANLFEYFDPIPKSMELEVPRLGIQEIDIDLKEIRSGQNVKKTIQITNIGGEPLEIRKLTTTCDCVQANLGNYEIGVNESTSLEFNFDTRGRKGIDHKHITIFSNDPINPIRTIVIKSNIK